MPSPLTALVTMRCADVAPMADATFVETDEGDVRVHAIPGTAADRDRKEIAAKRKAAIAAISASLGVNEDHIIDLWLSPSRAAATAHGLAGGQTRRSRVEVLYLDAPDSYERVQYGHEMTHVVAQHLDFDRQHLPLVNEGVAEMFDQSGRDLHRAFAQAIRVSGKTIAEAIATSEKESVVADYPKGGSFVKRLFERDPSPSSFRAFFRDVRVTGQSLDGAAVDAMLDAALQKSYGLDLATFRREWMAILEPLVATPTLVPPEDAAAITTVIETRHRALAERDAPLFRSTMEGFYCTPEWDDAKREAFAVEAVTKPASSNEAPPQILEILDTGLVNYRTAAARVTDGQKIRTIVLEKFPDPIGYRIKRVTNAR